MVIPEFQGTKNIKEPEKANSQYLAMTRLKMPGYNEPNRANG